MTDSARPDRNDRDSAAYDGPYSFVYEHGPDVVDLLDPGLDGRILDLRCGTGRLTDRIADSAAEVVGLDRSTEVIERARASYPVREFRRADAREFTVEAPLDAVSSNAVLHWIDDQDAVLDCIADALRPDGRFVAELGGRGNVATIVDAVREELAARGHEPPVDPWYFPTVGEHATRLEAHGFEARYATLFDRPTQLDDGEAGLAAWLGTFGDRSLGSVPEGDRWSVVGTGVEDRLRNDLYDGGTWTAHHRWLRFVAAWQPSE